MFSWPKHIHLSFLKKTLFEKKSENDCLGPDQTKSGGVMLFILNAPGNNK